MRSAVIVATARTPIGRAYRGAFNNLDASSLGAVPVKESVRRAGIDPREIEDCVLGCALQEGTARFNIARNVAMQADLPFTVGGMSINRACASGLMAVATAAKQITQDGMGIVIGGGVESISLVQNEHMNNYRAEDQALQEKVPGIYLPMLDTAEVVAKRYGISREAQDEYALQSQMRTAAAQEAGKFDDEIVPVTATKAVIDRETKAVSYAEVTLTLDEGNRPQTTMDDLINLKPVREGGTVTAGNASQLSDGASACVLMDSKLAEQKNLEPLGVYRGMTIAGCEPDEMGIGPVFAVPKLLKRNGRTVSACGS